MSPRTVAIPGLAWQAIEGSEVLGGGGYYGPITNDVIDQRTARSGYCSALVYALATARIVRRGKGRSYEVYLTDEARADLLELFDAIWLGARDDGTPAERQAILTASRRLA